MTADTYAYWPTQADASGAAVAASYWPTATGSAPTETGTSSIWKEGSGASFHDLLDIVNPLQHLPVVATVYRWLTGDEPGNLARVVGDGLYGGPIGAVTGMFNVITRSGDGEDMGERIMTWAFGPGHAKTEPDQGTAVAAATPAPVTATKLADLTPSQATAADAATGRAAPANVTTASATTASATTAGAMKAAAASVQSVPTAGSTRSVASVAALYRSTDPAAKRGAGSAVASVKPDHPPMPLVRTATNAAPNAPGTAPGTATAAATADAADPAHQLTAETAMMQRQMSGGRNVSTTAAGGQQLVNTPVPLQLTGQALPLTRPRAMAVAAQKPAPVQVAADQVKPGQANVGQSNVGQSNVRQANVDQAKTPPAPAAPTDLATGTPAEISQKMMSALDKYMRLQQQQHAATLATGGQVDVSP